MPTVTHVRKEPSKSGGHEHIAGVCSAAGAFYTREQVLGGLALNEDWHTSAGGTTAKIRRIEYCPHPGCSLAPYLTTAPDHTPLNNLENLPPC